MNVDARINWDGRADLYELLAAWCDGTLDEAACRRLEGHLGSENIDGGAAARRFYIEYLDMHARLRWDRREPAMARALQTAASTGPLDASSLARRSLAKSTYAAAKRRSGSSLFSRDVPRLVQPRSSYLAAAVVVVLIATVAAAWFVFQSGDRSLGSAVAQSRQPPPLPPSLPNTPGQNEVTPPACKRFSGRKAVSRNRSSGEAGQLPLDRFPRRAGAGRCAARGPSGPPGGGRRRDSFRVGSAGRRAGPRRPGR